MVLAARNADHGPYCAVLGVPPARSWGLPMEATRSRFTSVGEWYLAFGQLTDADALALLD